MEGTTRRYGWSALVVAACAATGCLIPQDDTLLEGVPGQRNRPPRIVESLVSPQQRVISDFGAGACDLTFEVVAEDPDLDDRLKVHWYVDYNPQDPRGPYRQYDLANITRDPLRSDRGSLLISLASANSPLGTPGTHLVEALVSDSELQDRVVQPRVVQLPDGTFIEDPGYVVTYAWVVNTVQGDCR
ncbi:hypothetical protein [Myxococcus sp. RHSTA-1-4]|uniref:hypothetical protein n=1 Tax=Myxococcus sp. RHSTA-1-4 TaxID=2874601 RepID=UPI001CBD9150|nr:hypothetical protein [Myxococcus sp. RHSTA-1-4]MBZ4419911.1 hypothetical protein [Myxococcus sp. RHSTA-1-4]